MSTKLTYRYSNRFDIKANVSWRLLTSKQNSLAHGVTVDLSLVGMQLFSQHLLVPGQELDLWLVLADTQDMLDVKGRVVWSIVDEIYGDSPFWLRAGVIFDTLSSEQHARLLAALPIERDHHTGQLQRKHLLAVLP